MLGYQADDRPYTGLSLTHGNAQAVTLGPSLHMGLRAVFSRRFTKSRLWDICRRYGCTTFSMLGGMATAIYSEPPRANDADNPVRMVIDAGMPGGDLGGLRAALRRARLRVVRRHRGRAGVQADRRRADRQLWQSRSPAST